MDMQLNGKTALVTGSTAGIGLEIARSLAVEGAHVFVTGRSQAKLDVAVKSIADSGGKNVTGVAADVGTAEGVVRLVKACSPCRHPGQQSGEFTRARHLAT